MITRERRSALRCSDAGGSVFCPQRSDHRHDNGGDHHTGCHQSGGCRCGLSEVRRDLGYQQRSGHGSASSTRCGNSSRATALTQHDIHDYQWYACDNNDCQSHKNTQQSGVDDDAKINGIPQRKCKEWDQTFGGLENNSRSSGSRLPSKNPTRKGSGRRRGVQVRTLPARRTPE